MDDAHQLNGAEGFCFFNNVAIAVKQMRKENMIGPNETVLIVDWDVHHGQGTENLFSQDEHVLYFSVHQRLERDGRTKFYPFVDADEADEKDPQIGEIETPSKFTVNVPLRTVGHGDQEYLHIWEKVLLPICQAIKPALIVISAGFDASVGHLDSLGDMEVTPPCYGLLTRLLLNQCSKVAMILEGGYCINVIAAAICCCNYALIRGPVNIDVNDKFKVSVFYAEFAQFLMENRGTELVQEFHSLWASNVRHVCRKQRPICEEKCAHKSHEMEDMSGSHMLHKIEEITKRVDIWNDCKETVRKVLERMKRKQEIKL